MKFVHKLFDHWGLVNGKKRGSVAVHLTGLNLCLTLVRRVAVVKKTAEWEPLLASQPFLGGMLSLFLGVSWVTSAGVLIGLGAVFFEQSILLLSSGVLERPELQLAYVVLFLSLMGLIVWTAISMRNQAKTGD